MRSWGLTFWRRISRQRSAAAGTAFFLQALLGDLAEVGFFVAFDDVGGGEVADDAVEANVAGNLGFAGNEDIGELFFGVGFVFTPLPILIEFGVLDENAGVEFEFVGADGDVLP